MLKELGGLAQLVERLLCKQDVSGSSPLTSTNFTYRNLSMAHSTSLCLDYFFIVNSHKSLLGSPSENLENCI